MATIGLILDIALVLALVIFGIIGFKKGFLQSVVSLFSWVVCIIVAIFTAKFVAGWINGIYDFTGLIGGKIATSLTKQNEFFGTAINAFSGGKEEVITSIPANTNKLLAQLIKVVFSNASVDMSSSETVASIVGVNLGHICMVIIAGLLVFVVLKIVVALLTKLFDNISKTKILGTLNKVLGLALGLLKASFIIVVLNGVLVGLSLIPMVNKTITPIIQDNTYVEKFVYNKTDEFVGEKIINGNVIQTWISDLWESR
ncbi:MAG: CvpA family protein [Clostridia bacterium]|nr:CvpA family protein [Clostridia bacterium]